MATYAYTELPEEVQDTLPTAEGLADAVHRELKILQSTNRPETTDIEHINQAYAELGLNPPAMIRDEQSITDLFQSRGIPRPSSFTRPALRQAVLDRITEMLDDAWTLRDMFDTYKTALWFNWRGCYAHAVDYESDWQRWKQHEPSLDEFLGLDIPADRLSAYAQAQWKAHQDGFIHGHPLPPYVVKAVADATRRATMSRDEEHERPSGTTA